MRHPDGHAVCLRNVQNTLADSVYSQLIWAIAQMGLENHFTARKSPLSLTIAATGQTIFFRGLDDPLKLKSIKPKFGYIRNIWFEKVAEMDGMETIRSALQSMMRGREKFNVFYSYNPSKSKNNWVNVAVEQESLRPDAIADGAIGPKTIAAAKAYFDRPGAEGTFLAAFRKVQRAHYHKIVKSQK